MSNKDTKTTDSAPRSAIATGEGDLIAALNAALVELHSQRLDRFGAERSGLFSHYMELLKTGRLLRRDEIEAFHLLRQHLPSHNMYVVLRAGLGELAFLLAAVGLPVIACEPNTARCEALEAGLDHLVGLGLVDRAQLQIVPRFVVERCNTGPVIAVATDFVFDLGLEEDEVFCDGLRRLDGLLLNPRLFIRLRESPAERLAVAKFLHSVGFEESRHFANVDLTYFVRSAYTSRTAGEGQRGVTTTSQPADFDNVVQRALALTPPMARPNPGTTWIERRRRQFDLRSAFGDDT